MALIERVLELGLQFQQLKSAGDILPTLTDLEGYNIRSVVLAECCDLSESIRLGGVWAGTLTFYLDRLSS